jgi:hypothetical protein
MKLIRKKLLNFISSSHIGELIDANLLKNFRPTDKAIEFYTVNKPHEPTNWLVKFHGKLQKHIRRDI